MKIYKLAENTISNDDYKLLIKFLQNRKTLTQSKIVNNFQKNFSDFLKTKYSIFVNSGSSANLLIAQVLIEGNFLKNRIVVLPSVSWATTVSPFIQLGYKVIFCDCDKTTLGLDPQHLERICKKYNPGLVVLVNVLGHSNNLKKITFLKKKYHFVVVEDNCESLGSYEKKKLGTYGLASSHSFYFGHHISTIEGGMVSTNNKIFSNISIAIRSHGWSRDMEKNYATKLEKKYNIDQFKSLYTFYFSGFNIRSTDLNAALGINQLKKINKISIIRHKNFNYYKIKLINFWSQSSNLNLVSSFGYATFVKNRMEVYKYLEKKKIQSRPVISGNMANQPFCINKSINKEKLKNAEFVDRYGLYLPNHANITKLDIDYITNCFLDVAEPIFFNN
jgi:CDP-6-deoxy-D-xylo-4-hexulose-3-dehydrase